MTVTDHTLTIRNVTVDALGRGKHGDNQRFALSWELRDARYHIWFDKLADLDPDTRTTAGDGVLYKKRRCIASLRIAREQLDPAAKVNAPNVEAARHIAVAGNLYQKALAAKNADAKPAREAEAEAKAARVVSEAAPDLLEALLLAEGTIMRLVSTHAERESVQGTLDVIEAAVIKAGR